MSSNLPKVLFAVNESTKSKFLPTFDAKKLPPFQAEWIDFSRLNPAEWDKYLLAQRPDIMVTCWESPAFPANLVNDESLPVRYICHLTGGIKGVAPRGLIERGILVSNWGGTISYSIAEHALLLTLGTLRNMPLWRANMSATSNEKRIAIPTRSLRGRKIGIHGFGAIVRHLVALYQPFGVTISSYSAGVPDHLFKEHGVHRCESLEELAANCEIFVELEALTPPTRGSVDARILNLLKPGTFFINVGRGAVVDEAKLAELATSGKITVGLDVFTNEPLSLDSPLMKIPSALLSPHIAGPTSDGFPLLGDFALSNLGHYLSGRPDLIEGKVTLEIWDRTT